jgi:hypothetical protein
MHTEEHAVTVRTMKNIKERMIESKREFKNEGESG